MQSLPWAKIASISRTNQKMHVFLHLDPSLSRRLKVERYGNDFFIFLMMSFAQDI